MKTPPHLDRREGAFHGWWMPRPDHWWEWPKMVEEARGFLDAIPALRNREIIVCGEGVSIPIRVALDNLEEAKRPASDDPIFTKLWSESGGEAEMLDRVVKRWRNQGR